MQAKPTPATAREIQNILGPSDEEIIRAIRATGATEKEVLQAFGWLESDDTMGKTVQKSMDDRTRKVYEILVDDLEEPEPDRR